MGDSRYMYTLKKQGWLKHWDFILIDTVCMVLAFFTAYGLRFHSLDFFSQRNYIVMFWFLVLLNLVAILFFHTLKGILKRGKFGEIGSVVRQELIVGILFVTILFFTQSSDGYSRIVLIYTGASYFVYDTLARVLWKRHLRRRMRDDTGSSLLVIAPSEKAEAVIASLKRNNYEMYNISGLILPDCSRVGEEVLGIPVVADEKTCLEYIARSWIDEILLIPDGNSAFSDELYHDLLETGLTVHVNLGRIYGEKGQKQLVEHLGEYSVLTSTLNYMTSSQAFAKRCMDIGIGLIGTALTGVIYIFLAPAIYIQSPGPVFFAQERVGQNGRRFKMYKFRSMDLNADAKKKELMAQNRVSDGLMFKMDFDPRIIGNEILPDGTHKTGLGEFIRKTSLDEFPQFFNVLKGDMSAVGTRPPTVDEWNKYDLYHRSRLAIKPGVTGMWQVSGRSEITDFDEVVRLDRQYILEWSPALDIKILGKTVWAVLAQKGSM